MGWETRGGRRYFYRKARQDGRIVSEYICSEDSRVAAFWTLAAADMKAIDWYRRALARGRKEARDAAERERAQYHRAVDLVAAAIVQAAGYHRHDRGRWRKRRMSTEASSTALARIAPDDAREIIRRAKAGEKDVLPQLQALFKQDPNAMMELGIGDIARTVRRLHIRRVAGDDLVVREAMSRKLDQVEAELAGPNPTPAERLLAERAALCWFNVNVLDAAEAKGPQAQARLERERNGAQRRFLTAVKTLANVRKLALPALQVNIAREQTIVGQQNNAEQQVVGDVHGRPSGFP